jgi:site-specific DNA-methyltransferase (adenine-specific)
MYINFKYKTDQIKVISGDLFEVVQELGLKFDMIFCDPPFNLSKKYESNIDDNLTREKYLEFQKKWLQVCFDRLIDGGSMFVFNLPKWNIEAGHQAIDIGFDFRNWIAVDMTLGMPISGRLYPSHYSLLYLTKGKPKTFNKIRTPVEKCRHCSCDIKDYGGHRKKLHPEGVSLKDIWTDIGKVSGKKNRSANELPVKLLKRIMELSTNTGDLVLDPFAGSGTTMEAAVLLNRRVVCIDLDGCEDIIKRIDNITKNKVA